MPAYNLTYFDIEGLAEKVRLAFKIAGVDFKDTRINFAEWGELKAKTPAGTLPTLTIDDGEPITQSGAMLRYIGATHDLAPKPADIIRAEQIMGIEEDIGKALAPSMYVVMRPQFYGIEDKSEEERTAIQAKLRAALLDESSSFYTSLKLLDQLYAKSESGFAVGDKPTIVDCQVFPLLRRLRSGQLTGIPTDLVDRFPGLVKFEKAFYAVPAVAAHYGK